MLLVVMIFPQSLEVAYLQTLFKRFMYHYMYLKGIISHLTYKLRFIVMNNVITVTLNQGDFTFQKTFGTATGQQRESSEFGPRVLLNSL